MSTPAMIPVWDRGVRSFHWLLAAAFFVAYISAEKSETIHTFAGYFILILISLRVIWGFIGSKHARFTDFVTSPQRTLEYLKAMTQLKHPRYIGHNPAGAAMIIALLILLALTGFLGMITLGIEEHTGPLAGWVQDMGWENDSIAEELHEFFANFSLFMIFLHLGGVFLESILHKENLIKAMIDGKKKRQP